MSYNFKRLLPKIQNAIAEYGVNLTIYRDIFESEVGVQTYKSTQKIATIKGVLDNSKGSTIKTGQESEFMQKEISGTLYYPYMSTPKILPGDYVIINDIKYILDTPVDLMEVGILYMVSVRGVRYEH